MEFFVFIPGWNLSYDYMEKNDVSSWDESFNLRWKFPLGFAPYKAFF